MFFLFEFCFSLQHLIWLFHQLEVVHQASWCHHCNLYFKVFYLLCPSISCLFLNSFNSLSSFSSCRAFKTHTTSSRSLSSGEYTGAKNLETLFLFSKQVVAECLNSRARVQREKQRKIDQVLSQFPHHPDHPGENGR